MAGVRVLVLTNRDSDNVGDQVIEASVLALIKAAMKNLGVSRGGYTISSRAAGIISKAYLQTGDPALLKGARAAISSADLIVFGGAPLFNYSYQNFYLRTIKTLELAEEYGVPVLFSSIGVEPFDADNEKCIELRDALQLSCVRQITTRDDLDSTRRYVEGTDTPVALVSDPAVFADTVFERRLVSFDGGLAAAARRIVLRFIEQRAGGAAARGAKGTKSPGRAKKRIGLVVTRAGIFRDNGIAFTERQQREFWMETIALLTERGYDYRLFTTGHFSDEVFLDALVKAERIPQSKVRVTVNSPEELTDEIGACDGVIAYRLHASITSFAYEVPSIGLSWNFKVPRFYETAGHPDRALPPEEWTATTVVDAIERAMREGVRREPEFLMSVYRSLFDGIKGVVAPESTRSVYTLEQLRASLPRYEGTGPTQYREKVERKFRRTYENYQRYSKYYLKHSRS